MLLKKYKLENLLFSNPQSFLIMELLPMSETELVALGQDLNKLGFKIQYIKTKKIGGILTNRLSLNKNKKANILSGNLIFIYSIKNCEELLFKNFPFKLFKTSNKNLSEKKSFDKLLFLGLYHEGVFYNSNTILNLYSVETFNVSKKKYGELITQTLSQNSNLTLNVIQSPITTLIRTLDLISLKKNM